MVTKGWRSVSTVNLGKIRACVHYTGEKSLDGEARETPYDTITLKVVDERNALERVMLHFAHFEKQAEKLDMGWDIMDIKHWLRHSSIDVTTDIYTHISNNRKKQLSQKLVGTFEPLTKRIKRFKK